jgi:hypothetical protein
VCILSTVKFFLFLLRSFLLQNSFIIILSGVRLEFPCTAATSGLLYQPQMIGEGDCGAIGGKKIGRGNRSTRRKSASVPLCPPQIPHDQTRARTPSAALGSQRLNHLSYYGAGSLLQNLHVTVSRLELFHQV